MDNKQRYEYLQFVGENKHLLSSFRYDSLLQKCSNDFAATHCIHPVKVYSTDYYTGESVYHYYNCGKCNHCRNIKSNNLLSRIYLDLPFQGYLYFVTLTYSSVYLKRGNFFGFSDFGNRSGSDYRQYKLSPRVLELLSKNILHFDNYNHKSRYCYSCCSIDMDDFAGFMKRLRKQMPDVRFQFVCFGEYGHKYGHPHMHALVSSNQPINLYNFRSAWSLYGCPIGSCYVDNISQSTEGSLPATVKYVTKYVSKTLDSYNDIRMKFAYYGKYGISYYNGLPKYITPYILDNFDKFDKQYVSQFNNVIYDFNFFKSFPSSFVEYKRQACKRPRYSNRNCFGSLYYSANSKRFLEGNLELPKSSSFSVSFPSYFSRRIRKQKYPLAIYKRSFSNSSFLCSSSVPFVVRAFKEFCSPIFSDFRLPLGKCSSQMSALVGKDINSAHFYLADSGTHLLYEDCKLVGYRYDKRSKSFQKTGFTSSLTALYKYYISCVIQRYKDDICFRRNKEYSDMMYDLLKSPTLSPFWDVSIDNEENLWSLQKSKILNNVQQSNFNVL